MNAATLWCPACGAEYVAGSRTCNDCRVLLTTDHPDHTEPREGAVGDRALVTVGDWPRLEVQILRRRLESAAIDVMVEWSGTGPEARGTLIVPQSQSEFAQAVINEIDVDDEVPDTSPAAYVVRIEEHLSAAAGLLDELRTRLDQLEGPNRPR